MIRVAIVIPSLFANWLGGITYYRNLLYALHVAPHEGIEPVLITGNKLDPALLHDFPAVETLRTNFLDYYDAKWFARMLINKTIGTDFFLEGFMRRKGVSLISHYQGYLGKRSRMKIVGWIPDFQHKHFPELFSNKENAMRDITFENICALSARLILSSQDAFRDLLTFAPEFAEKARVLHFVSQPSTAQLDQSAIEAIKVKYKKFTKFFFLPNQFWIHKNHMVVWKAVKILKERNENVIVLCSGSLNDYRNKDHIRDLTEYLRNNHLEESIHILGVIDRQELFYLMRNSVSVLNPSLFEGWSTTVEEAKSIGKNVILSDIGVHREQAPPEAIYFDPRDAQELANILQKKYRECDGGPDYHLEEQAKNSLKARTIAFAHAYQQIILEAVL